VRVCALARFTSCLALAVGPRKWRAFPRSPCGGQFGAGALRQGVLWVLGLVLVLAGSADAKRRPWQAKAKTIEFLCAVRPASSHAHMHSNACEPRPA
jgi:hypothetical protein